jgi:hypothetical protein
MSDIIESTVNAEPVEVVDQQEVTEVTENEETTEQTEQQTETTEQTEKNVIEEVVKPQQSAEDNAKFASVRREAEKKARDSVIAEMYGKSHGINTYEQYQQAVAEQEKQKQIDELGDIPEEVAREIVEARELKKQIEEQSKKDKEIAEFVQEFPGVTTVPQEVWDIVNQKGKDLTSAYAIYLSKNMDKLKTETEQETLKKIKQNAETSTGSIQSNAQSNDNMTVDQVNKLLEGMGKGERDKWIDKNMDNLEKWGYFKKF